MSTGELHEALIEINIAIPNRTVKIRDRVLVGTVNIFNLKPINGKCMTTVAHKICFFLTKNLLLLLTVILVNISSVHAEFVHPGLSHKLSDLDRMKHMVNAGVEPYASSFDVLASHSRAQFDVEIAGGRTGMTTLTRELNRFLVNDGIAAYYNALMWYITGDARHAEKAIEVFTVWSDLRRQEINLALTGGRHWKLIEAAEIIKSTYSGWEADDIQKFKDMLVYPGYSNTTIPTDAINSGDSTLYWLTYQGDDARHGNQGIFAMRVVMAMGVFLDNEIMYDRAARYLRGLPHRSDDLPYPSGPPILSGRIAVYEHFEEFRRAGREDTIEDYGYNEVISNYIYENGQSQESSRDQAHALGGVATLATMAEIDWNQGGDLYSHLDNRILSGLNFWYRYNLSWVESFPDQTSPWEPTVESGEYIRRSDRSGRWLATKINPYLAQTTTQDVFHRGRIDLLTAPAVEPSVAHYKDRMGLPSDDTKWLERGFDFLIDEIGMEPLTTTDYLGLGGLKSRRVSPGDPISGFAGNGNPEYAMNEIPIIIEAENFDFFTLSGEGRTYSDTSSGNTGNAYRIDENVDIENRSAGGFNVGSIDSGEWLTYTVSVPESDVYDIAINYAGMLPTGGISFEFNGRDRTGEIALPSTGGAEAWDDLTVATGITLTQGVHSMKVRFSGASNSINLNSITIIESGGPIPTVKGGNYKLVKRNATDFAIDGGGGAVVGRSVELYENVNHKNMTWTEIDLGNGHVAYQKFDTNVCMDGGNGGANGQSVILDVCNPSDINQQWQKIDIGSGSYQLQKRNTDFSVDGGGGGARDQNVYLWRTNSRNQNQHWRYDERP